MPIFLGVLIVILIGCKEIISRISENTLWLFTEHEAHNHEALRIKKIKLRRYGFRGSFGIYDG